MLVSSQTRFFFVGGATCSVILSVVSCDFDMDPLSVLQSVLRSVGSTAGTHTRSLPGRERNNYQHVCTT